MICKLTTWKMRYVGDRTIMSSARYDAYTFIAKVVSPYVTGDKIIHQLKGSQVLDWEKVASVAAAHSIIQVLYSAFTEKELITYIPNEFLAHVEHMHELNCKRNEMLRKQLTDATLIINELGIKATINERCSALIFGYFFK